MATPKNADETKTLLRVDPLPSCSTEMVERYIASIQQEHDRWNAFREQAMDRQQFTLVARYGDVCDVLKMAINQARRILLPNAERTRGANNQ